MNKQNIFTKKDLDNLKDGEKLFKVVLDDKGNFVREETDCWFTHFYIYLKDGRRFRFDMNDNTRYTLKSDKYGEFEVNQTEKVVAETMKDNDRLYVIKQEMDFIANVDYYYTARFVATRWEEFFRDNFGTRRDIIKMLINRALEDKNFATIAECD